MAKAIVLLNVLGSIASLVGLAALYYGSQAVQMRSVWQLAFLVTIFLSLYVLFTPDNPFEQNVKAKFKRYNPTGGDRSTLCVLEGTQAIQGTGPLSVKFDVPFMEPPEVELVNTGRCGSDQCYHPIVKEITRFQFVVLRPEWRGNRLTGEAYQDEFGWIATGHLMPEAKVKT